jgi:hypothetical protein
VVRFDPRVRIRFLTAPIAESLRVLCEASFHIEFDIWVSSMNDREHSITSLHYNDLGIDFVPDYEEGSGRDELLEKATIFVQRRLSKTEYDVINEGDHSHIEWDPKN